jgi:hypothetical protein
MTTFSGPDDATTSSFVYNLPGAGTAEQIGGTDPRLFNLTEGLAPLNYMKDIVSKTGEFLADIEGAAVLLDSQFQSIVNTMGQGQNMAQSIKTELSEGTIEILKLGGKTTDAAKVQTDTLESLGRNVVLSSEEMSQFYSLSRATGVELKTLQQGFLDIGVSIHNIDDEMVKVIDVANALGVSTKAVSDSVVANLGQLNRFNFKDGIEGLAKMAAKASILRFDMKETFGLADRMLDPQNAIEASAALQRLGATASSLTDPLQLMNLSQNNLPELQKQLGSLFQSYTQFDEKTGRFEIMPGARKQLKEIASSLNMDLKEVEKLALGTADLDKKMSEIDFSGIEVEDETKELIASMSTMKGGQYVVKIEDEQGKQQEKTIQDLITEYQGQPDKLKEILQAQQSKEAESPEEKMLSIATAQKDILTDIRSNLQAGAASVTLQAGATIGQEQLKLNREISLIQSQSIQENFGPGSEYAKGLEDATESLKSATEELKKGNYEEAATKFGAAVTEFSKGAAIAAGKTVVDISTELAALIGAEDKVTEAIGKLATEVKGLVDNLGNFLGIKSQDAIIDPGNSIITQEAGGSLVKLLPDPQDLAFLIKKTEIEKKQENFRTEISETYNNINKPANNFEGGPFNSSSEELKNFVFKVQEKIDKLMENFQYGIDKFKKGNEEEKQVVYVVTDKETGEILSRGKDESTALKESGKTSDRVNIKREEVLAPKITEFKNNSELIPELSKLLTEMSKFKTTLNEEKGTGQSKEVLPLISINQILKEFANSNTKDKVVNLTIPKSNENQVKKTKEDNIFELNKPKPSEVKEIANSIPRQLSVQGGAVIEIKHDISIDSSKSPGLNPQDIEKKIIESFGQNNVMQKLKTALNDVYFGLEKPGTKNKIYQS